MFKVSFDQYLDCSSSSSDIIVARLEIILETNGAMARTLAYAQQRTNRLFKSNIYLLDVRSQSSLSQAICVEIELVVKDIGKELFDGMVALQCFALLAASKKTISFFQSEPHALHIGEILQR